MSMIFFSYYYYLYKHGRPFRESSLLHGCPDDIIYQQTTLQYKTCIHMSTIRVSNFKSLCRLFLLKGALYVKADSLIMIFGNQMISTFSVI